MNKVLTRNAAVRSIADELIENRQIDFTISSEKVDKHRTVFRKDGWILDEYMRNPIVLYNHDIRSSDPDTVIGTSEVRFEGDELVGRVTFEPAELNPLAEKVFRKIIAGTLKMASVGAYPEEAHFGKRDSGEDPDVLYFTKQRLVEWSVVPAGSNADAHKRNTEGIQEWRDKLVQDIEVDPEPSSNEQMRAFEAQVIINKNFIR